MRAHRLCGLVCLWHPSLFRFLVDGARYGATEVVLAHRVLQGGLCSGGGETLRAARYGVFGDVFLSLPPKILSLMALKDEDDEEEKSLDAIEEVVLRRWGLVRSGDRDILRTGMLNPQTVLKNEVVCWV